MGRDEARVALDAVLGHTLPLTYADSAVNVSPPTISDDPHTCELFVHRIIRCFSGEIPRLRFLRSPGPPCHRGRTRGRRVRTHA